MRRLPILCARGIKEVLLLRHACFMAVAKKPSHKVAERHVLSGCCAAARRRGSIDTTARGQSYGRIRRGKLTQRGLRCGAGLAQSWPAKFANEFRTREQARACTVNPDGVRHSNDKRLAPANEFAKLLLGRHMVKSLRSPRRRLRWHCVAVVFPRNGEAAVLVLNAACARIILR